MDTINMSNKIINPFIEDLTITSKILANRDLFILLYIIQQQNQPIKISTLAGVVKIQTGKNGLTELINMLRDFNTIELDNKTVKLTDYGDRIVKLINITIHSMNEENLTP